MSRRRVSRSRGRSGGGSGGSGARSGDTSTSTSTGASSSTGDVAGDGGGTRLPPAGPTGMARKCCVRTCGGDVREARARGHPLHRFPKDAALRARWLASGGFDPAFSPTPGQVVCHRHFRRADYEAAKGSKLLLRKGSVPSVFRDYDNHPDPVVMSVKSSISYAQEDLDLINSEILNLGHSSSPLLSEARTPKSDSSDPACSKLDTSTDTNPTESIESASECVGKSAREESMVPVADEIMENPEMKVNTMAVRLGIVEPEASMVSVAKDLAIKEELKNIKVAEEKDFDKNGELKTKLLNRGLKFFPGAKLEAKDFNDKWYSAKVVETDWVEREVLIHFDKWSSRFDEWIPMDSSRLRVLQSPPNEQAWILPAPEAKMREFSVGERILATWADGKKYPAKVNAVLGNDRYDVLFDDGYAKIVRSSKMTKIAATPTKPQTSQDEGYIGSKQERRDKKRKHTVMELFYTHSKKRTKNEVEKPVKKEETVSNENMNKFLMANKVELDGTLYDPCYDPGTDLLKGFDTKVKTYPKKGKKEPIKNDHTQEEDIGPEWIDGEPQGIESYIVDGNDGPRRSIIVPDKRLPSGWQKHFTQRKAGTSAGKWDVLFIHKSSGKKFRSRNDIRAFMENQGQFDFDPEKFDFCIHRKKRNHVQKAKQDTSMEVPKKIKTLLPKTKPIQASENTVAAAVNTPVLPTVVPTPTTPNGDSAVFMGGLRVEMEDSAYKCPKQGCNKNFRKENLLQMHIKHYHPEYAKFLGSTPNVADLAYARTIGESIEDIIPKKTNNFLDKINKLGKRKSIQDKPSPSASQPATLQPISPSNLLSSLPDVEEEANQADKCAEPPRDETKIETMSPLSSRSVDLDEEADKKRENPCGMSPGSLFDLKVREEKTQVGIKTLLPVRPAAREIDAPRADRSRSFDETVHVERGKNQRKRHFSEYASDPSRGKRRAGTQDVMDEYQDLDDSAMDVEGPATLTYRYSRRKSDSKSDENSQNSQLNDSRLEKGDSSKGDGTKRDNNNEMEECEGGMIMVDGELIKLEPLRREEIINCTCGLMEEDGLMIQCDICLCWQHGHCNKINREQDVPEKYVCYTCLNPYRQRPSRKYFHDQEWMNEGKLPSLPNRTRNEDAINRRTAMLKRSFVLVAALLKIQNILHSLRVKINVAQKKDHPKLYLWAKNWEKVPVPKPDLEPVPVMEYTKASGDSTDSEASRRVESRPDSKPALKDDPDEKSIASDSELMKILEEDSTNSDESKVVCKSEEPAESTGNHILLDALQHGSPEGKQKNAATKEEVKEECTEPLDRATSETTEDPASVAADVADDAREKPREPEVGQEIPAQQPFIPEPEAPIDPAECRMRLLEHIEHFQNHIESRLFTIEAQVSALEALDPDEPLPSEEVERKTKQTIQMLMRDLSTVRKLAALC